MGTSLDSCFREESITADTMKATETNASSLVGRIKRSGKKDPYISEEKRLGQNTNIISEEKIFFGGYDNL